VALTATAVLFLAGAPTGFGQVVGSVYMDDSPAAQDGLARALELAGVGNLDEAVRVLQRLLDENADQLVQESANDADLYVSVRSRVHAALLSTPALLERYRALELPTARALLATDQTERCERTRLLTAPGLEAALRLAQNHIDRARFPGAYRLLLSLDAHPDLVGDRLKDGVALLASAAAYLDADARTPQGTVEDARRLLDAWRDRAGVPRAEAAKAESPVSDHGLSVLDPQPAAALGDVLARPLASEFLGSSLEGVDFLAGRIVQNQRGVSDRAAVLHAIPTVAGDSLYVNDSETITAWDRYTLSKRWRVRIEPPTTVAMVNASGGLGIEDCNWTAVEGHRLATVSGLTMLTRTQAERAVSVLDTRYGRVLWTTTLSQLGPSVLSECFPRGPVVIDQGVVIVSAARNSIEKRLQGAILVGLDLETGRLLWWRNLGSLGVVPWGMGTFPADITRANAGVVYRADRTGIITALDSVTGRTLWARRLSPDPVAGSGLNRGGRIVPWEGNTPVIEDGRLIVLSPDKRMVVVIEAASGRILERIPSQTLNNPDYLMLAPSGKPGVASRLICVAPSQIGMVDLSGNIGGTPYQLLASVIAPGVRGRVMVAGDELIVPTIEGVLVVPIRAGASAELPPEARTIRLNRPGQILALGGQLIAVDDQQAHSYLLWETAEQLLEARMKADPANPLPAVTYAELAYQAGKQDKLVPAVDRAVRAMEKDPLSTASGSARRRLFVSLMDMVEPPADNPGAARLVEGVRADIVGRLEQLAATPVEQVRATMAAATLDEGSGRIPEAVDRYQSVLLTPTLASETYARSGTTLPADAEATRRLRRLVREHGRTVYAAYDAEAGGKLDAARATGTDADLEKIARSYPVSAAAPRAWLDLAERHRRAGREALALASLDEALNAAVSSLSPSDPMLAEVCAAVAGRIADSQRPRAALRMLDAVERALGGKPLASNGPGSSPVDLAALRAGLSQRLVESERRASVGAPSGSASVINGWGVLSPICGETPGAPTDRLVLGSATGEIAVWKAARNADGTPGMDKVWGDAKAEAFLRIDSRSVLLAKTSPTAPPNTRGDLAFARHDLATGNVVWEMPSFRALFTERSRRPFPSNDERIDTPLRSQIPASEMVVLADERTLVLMDRVGRAAAFDQDTGRLLWASELAVDRVYDAALSDGVLAVAGTPARSSPVPVPNVGAVPPDKVEEERRARAKEAGIALPESDDHPDDAPPSIVQVLGARTGVSQSVLPERTDVRWVRITPEGWVVYAGSTTVTCLDAYRLEARWRTEGSLVQDTVTAWALPGRIVTRDSDGKFRIISSESGEVLPPTLDTLGKADQPFIEASAAWIDGRTAILTSRGIVLHDAAGKVVGADALGSETVVRAPILAREAAVLVEQAPSDGPIGEGGPATYGVHVVSTTTGKMLGSAKVELPRSPTDAAVIDGMIVVSSGSACVLLNAPGAGK
jgi:outer membrane protein assembly factor BamB/tetratricopeptide (TPR) repeat protein